MSTNGQRAAQDSFPGLSSPERESILGRLDDLKDHISQRFDGVDRRIDTLEQRFDKRIDKLGDDLSKAKEDATGQFTAVRVEQAGLSGKAKLAGALALVLISGAVGGFIHWEIAAAAARPAPAPRAAPATQ